MSGAPGAADGGAAGRGEAPRASARARKASAAMAHVDEDARRQAATARLDALEADNAAADAAEDSDEYNLADDLEGSGPAGGGKRKRGAKRTTRGAAAERKGPKPLSQLLEEARLDALPPGVPSYERAAMGPPRAAAPRKFCSVCGFTAPYTCPRCGMRYCSRRCSSTHADTRCLRFTVY